MKDIDAFGRKMKLRAHFETDGLDKIDLERKFYATNKLWEPTKTHHTVLTFLEVLKNDTKLALDHTKPYTSSNLSKNEERALEDLKKRTDIFICKADKGGATVIIDVKDYIGEATRQLNDGNFYKKTHIGSDKKSSWTG